MQYQVPQFIEVEDKIFGPLTLKQFIYIAGGGGVCLLLFSTLPFFFTILLGVPVMALSFGLAFYHVNNRPLIVVLEHAFSYYLGSKLYLWKQRTRAAPAAENIQASPSLALPVPKLSESRLKDLSWSLNIKDRSKVAAIDAPHPGGFEI